MCKNNVFYLFNDTLQIKYSNTIQPDMHITQFQDSSLKINCYYIVCKGHTHINKQNIICYIKYTTLLYSITLKTRFACPTKKQLYFIPVFVYTHIKVKLKKGR